MTETAPPSASPADMAAQIPMLFVQSIKGAPASVLLALAVTGTFMSHKDLQLWTRCGHGQISWAVRLLQTLGWVRGRTSRGPWALAHGRHLSIPFFSSDASALKALNDDDDSLNRLEEETSSSSASREHLRAVLAGNGIEEPTASELAALPYVTEDYILAHVSAARAKGLSVGVAIERMRIGGPPPAAGPKRDRAADQEEKIRRFREGI
jgi:hypothetical protein